MGRGQGKSRSADGDVKGGIMAYFANSSEGEYYESMYCHRCVHFGEIGEGCPVLKLHSLWDYEARGGDKLTAAPTARVKRIALDTLWPREGVHNGQCKMFYEAPK